jgi:uncharacterized SAM-binding protein YcdF (DUF218 family)
MPTYLVIFGAAVHPDGSPSGTLARRVTGAISAGRAIKDVRYMPTGGPSAGGHVEADVMRDMLIAAGVAPDAIVCERDARDTLQSIRNCHRLLRQAGDVDCVVPCTSRYHIPRCALLLRLLDWTIRTVPMPGDSGALPWRKLIWYYGKELIALPYDALLLLVERRALLR